jgi:hypothetical protein
MTDPKLVTLVTPPAHVETERYVAPGTSAETTMSDDAAFAVCARGGLTISASASTTPASAMRRGGRLCARENTMEFIGMNGGLREQMTSKCK